MPYNDVMTLPSYDIVIPCYNRAHSVGDTLESALAQTRPPARIVIVDDHSSDADRLPDIIEGKGEHISLLRQEVNRGVSAARNTGAARCSSDWIAFLDSDDTWLPDAAQDMLGLADGQGLDVVVGHYRRVRMGGTPSVPECSWDGKDIHAALRTGGVIGPSWSMIRRTAFDASGGFDENLRTCEDWDLFLRLSTSGARFGRTDSVVAHYRTVEGDRLMDDDASLRECEIIVRERHDI